MIIYWFWARRSSATIDNAILIGGSKPQAQRLGRHEDQLLPWHQELLKLGICDYSLEEAQYGLH